MPRVPLQIIFPATCFGSISPPGRQIKYRGLVGQLLKWATVFDCLTSASRRFWIRGKSAPSTSTAYFRPQSFISRIANAFTTLAGTAVIADLSFYSSIGLAESMDGGKTWLKWSPAPIMSRSRFDPCLVTSPHVLWHEGRYRMTYVSGIRWSMSGDTLKSHYHIKYADSDDGIAWNRSGIVAVDFADADETNVARSSVIKDGNRLHMWFCYVRGNTPYRIGYAESRDYVTWERNDEAAGIDVSASGWDSEMICYPNISVHGGRAYMFYNGNAFGRDGFGVAVSDAVLG